VVVFRASQGIYHCNIKSRPPVIMEKSAPLPPAYEELYPASEPSSLSLNSYQFSRPTLEKQHENDEILDQALAFTHRPPALGITIQRLQKPIAIPQVHPDIGMPFARAYSEALSSHDITREEFTEFLDNLNVSSRLFRIPLLLSVS
jgi:hypothetical protein